MFRDSKRLNLGLELLDRMKDAGISPNQQVALLVFAPRQRVSAGIHDLAASVSPGQKQGSCNAGTPNPVVSCDWCVRCCSQ